MDESGFRKLIVDIQEQLNSDNMEAVLFLYKIPDEYKKRSRLEVLQYLQRHGVFGAHSPEKMKKFLEVICRLDLYCFVDDYNKRKADCGFQSSTSFTLEDVSSEILPSGAVPLSPGSPSIVSTVGGPGNASVQDIAIERRISSTQGVTAEWQVSSTQGVTPLGVKNERQVSCPQGVTPLGVKIEQQVTCPQWVTPLGVTAERKLSCPQGVTPLGVTAEWQVSSTQGVTLLGVTIERQLSCPQGVTGFQGTSIEPQVSPSQHRATSNGGTVFSDDEEDNSTEEGSLPLERHHISGACPEPNGVQMFRELCHQGNFTLTKKLNTVYNRIWRGSSLRWKVDLNTIRRACLQQKGKPLSHRAIALYVESTQTQVKFLPQLFPCGIDGDVGRAVTLEFTIQLPRRYLRSLYFAEASLEVSTFLSNDPDSVSHFSERRSCKLGERKVTFHGIISHAALKDALNQHLIIEAAVTLTCTATCIDDGDYVLVNH